MWKWIPATVFITASIVVALSVSADQLGSEYGLVESSGVINGDGEVSANIDQAGYYIYDSTQVAQYGGSCASNHALGTGDAIDCNDREINGTLYADGNITLAANKCLQGGGMSACYGFMNTPKINLTSGAKYSELTWNRLSLGGDGGGIGCINQTFAYDDLTDGGGAVGTLVLDEGIPDGAVVQQAILHSLTGFTGDTNAAITVGDGTDVDRYNTGTPSVFTTNASGVALGVPSGTIWHDDAKNITVTITTNADYTSVSAGQATILVCYWTP